MPSHDGKYSSRRGPDPGSLPSAVSQDRDVSRRIRFFHLVAPDGGQRRPDAAAEKGSPRGSARGQHGDGRGVAPEGTGGGRPEIGWIYRPNAIAAFDRGSAAGISNDFFAA